MYPSRNYAKLTPNGDGSLSLASSYDPAMIAAMKTAIPYTARRWDGESKTWVIDAQYGQAVADIVKTFLGITLGVPRTLVPTDPIIVARRLEYLGLPKEREDGTTSAFGYADGSWSLVIPLDALRVWFDPSATRGPRPTDVGTFYGVLGVTRDADDAEIKKAYRRAARTYHPDVNREPDAAEQFKRINEAYQVLSDPVKRSRYEFGLTMATTQPQQITGLQSVWRPPLRCGWVLVGGVPQVGRFVVDTILGWEDIVNDQGKTLVTSWPAGATTFEESWV